MDDIHLINSDQSKVTRPSFHNTRRSLIKCVVERKTCPLCNEFIDIVDFLKHLADCSGPDNTPPNQDLLPIQEPVVSDESTDDDAEHTPSYTEQENNLHDSVLSSTQEPVIHDGSTDDDTEYAPNYIEQENNLSDPLQSSIQEPVVDAKRNDDQPAHANNCTELENTLSETLPLLIPPPVDYGETNDDDYADSLAEWDNISLDAVISSTEPSLIFNEPNDNSSSRFQPIKNDDEGTADEFNTPPCMSPITIDENSKKLCILCNNMINESEFIDHMTCCSDVSSVMEVINDKPPIHIPEPRFSESDDEDSIPHCTSIRESMKDCIICSKPIKESEYVAHVHACLSETPERETITCFSCHRLIDPDDHLSRVISCPSHHIYCLTCLQYSMEKFVRTRSIPLCHLTLCDYELSRHDISLIPLERRISDRLLKLARGQQRPQCPKCHFYVDVNENEDFHDHIDVCDGDLIPCEYCSCPYSLDQLENHTRQCRNDRLSQTDKLTNFLIGKTKYPFTKEQIRFFIQQKKTKNDGYLDPLTIVNALAVFGPIFPCDIPTKECDVCTELCPYEDIYVFDCPDNHKLCYSCYYRSCQTKMSNGEILTCSLCKHRLRDGELSQLRASDEEIKQIRAYQMKKTLDDYSSHTRGIIKCPNQNCSWIAEAEDPTARFKVQCPLCQREFCSLCNQQYHYRTTCQQLPQITQQWYLWCQTERTRYVTIRAREDAVYADRLNEYNRQMNENEDRNRDLRRRYEELQQDEQYKIQHCRLCPSCQRVVERLQGCDQMICGQDAHGGNIQSGCGTKFNWMQAQPYTATTTFQAQQSIINLPKPEHPLVPHLGVQCDQCQNDVIGIRFDCIHCPTLTFCEKCEQQATLDHSHENQERNQQSHVFRLIMTPEEVSS